ncbi:PspC domain-containing protein [uncultured Bacteroides sp.]|uniref:PspC domain-containing protein n=1 Tax=uncultured Bacteroides sp. TaxID=162156 RepID=UPI0026161FBF|nr:PspC domain-containing protein [uncultured Bacteroides sp.]
MENPKRLLRPVNGKMIAGVCAGIANYFDIDPTIVRIIYVLMFFMLGTGILLYLILWLVIPQEKIYY